MTWNVTPLFAIPFYSSRVIITPAERMFVTQIEYDRVSANNGDVSTDTDILDTLQFSLLKQQIMDHLHIFLKEFISIDNHIEFYITSSWVMRHSKGDLSHRHNHSNSLYSGVVYIDVESDSGDFIVHKTHVNLTPPCFTPSYQDWNIFNSNVWTVKPKTGDIFIFPSGLDHEVTPNNNEKDRYCVAFNVFMRGNIGKWDNSTISKLDL